MIHFKNVYKSFGTEEVLRGLSLPVAKGKITVVMGPSGAGKSVMLKLLMGLLKVDSGEILIAGENVCTKNEKDLKNTRKQIGMLFQDGALFDYMTVMDNMAFPLQEHRRLPDETIIAQVEEKLKEVGLEKMSHKLPSELSGGMRKRVGLARALMLDPQVILFDEPTTGLDPITTSQIGELILNTQKSRDATVLMINHDLPLTYKVADVVAMLYKGEIVEICKPQELKNSSHPFVRDFLEAQVRMEKAQ